MTGVPGALSVNALSTSRPLEPLHAHVRDDQVVAAGGRALDRARAVVDRFDVETFAAQDLAQQIARDAIVLGDQHAHAHARLGGTGAIRHFRTFTFAHARTPPVATRGASRRRPAHPWRGKRTKNVDP